MRLNGCGFELPMSHETAELTALENEVPFFIPARQEPDGTWFFSCTRLTRDGRCGAYEDRPHVCRSYRPGEDALCVHFWAEDDARLD